MSRVGMTNDTPEAERAITVSGLAVELTGSPVDVVRDIDFSLAPGEILGLIGESGSGKTTVGSALLGYARPGTRISAGSVLVGGTDLLALDRAGLRRLRGAAVSSVPQDPRTSLNPAMRIGVQLEETLSAHGVSDRQERRDRIREILEEVRLPADRAFLRRHPHQISGGQQQRVVIAMAFLCRPSVVVLDEPTTGLDVTTQAHVLCTVRELCRARRTAAVYVSHDLAVVADLADRIAVMYSGRLVELGPAAEVTRNAGHPYSRALLDVVPDVRERRALRTIRGQVAPLNRRPTGCAFADRCDLAQDACREGEIAPVTLGEQHLVRCLRSAEVRGASRTEDPAGPAVNGQRPEDPERQAFMTIRGLRAGYSGQEILHGIDLSIPQGIVMALVGESGSGKTTLARCIGGLHDEASGEMAVAGRPLRFGARHRSAQELKSVQYIFQSASEALNPRRTVGRSLEQPLRVLGGEESPDARIAELMADVALGAQLADRYPSQLSGGERQRVTIARALATRPSILVCDEITSALDVSVQASILLLLKRLRAEQKLTLLFVTHNLAVVRAVADRVAVLDQGRIVEEGPVDQVLDSPVSPYTQQLMQDTPGLTRA